MGTVYGTGISEDELWRREHPELDPQTLRPWHQPKVAHTEFMVVGRFREKAVCATCGTILTAHHEPRLITRLRHDGSIEWQYETPGVYAGEQGDPFNHLIPFTKPDDGSLDHHQDDTSQHLDTSPTPRPAGIPAGAPERSPTTPSRQPAARHEEYVRRKRRARA